MASRRVWTAVAAIIIVVVIIAAVVAVVLTAPPAPTPAKPTITITSPLNGATINGTSVTIVVSVANFTLVNKLGQANVSGEGHIHYYKNVPIPTNPNALAITAVGTYVPTIATSYTWTNLTPGNYFFGVQLVNNMHYPIIPLVTASVNVTVQSVTPPPPVSSAVPPEVAQYAADWPLPSHDYANTRATTTTGITAANAHTLALAWKNNITAAGAFGGSSTIPVIMGQKVYFQDIWDNIFVYNLTTGATELAVYNNATTQLGPNGVCVGYGKIFGLSDLFNLSAYNLTTGQKLWTTQLSNLTIVGVDIQPMVYDNTVFVASVPGAGDVFYQPGGVGQIFALNASTGAIMWNFSTVKGGSSLFGHPDVNSGGGCWYPPAIDPATNTTYWGIANPAPFAGAPGWPSGSSFDAALYCDSMMALNGKTGTMEWYTQALAHDIWDHDFEISPILASGFISGKQQDVVIGSGKMGNVYCFNHATGALLWETLVGVHINDTLDPITGPTWVTPGEFGGVETPMAYANGLVFVPIVNMATQYIPTGVNASTIFNFANGTGELVAIDVNTGHIVWDQQYPTINVGGATVVNDVVFTGTFDGKIYGYNITTGAEVFNYTAPAGINGWPAIAQNTIVWPCGLGANRSVIALRLPSASLGASLGAKIGAAVDPSAVPPEVTQFASDWPMMNHDYTNSRATTTSTITSSNVATLAELWNMTIIATGSFGGASSNPVIMGNVTYFQDLYYNTYALNTTTGEVNWVTYYNNTLGLGPNGLAVGYGKVFGQSDPYNVTAWNITNGNELWRTKLSNVSTTGIDIQMQVYGGLVYASTVPGRGDVFYTPGGIGQIFALDQANGSIVWNVTTVIGNSLWGHPDVNSGGGCWYPPSIDLATGEMYWGISNPAPFPGTVAFPSGSSFQTMQLYCDGLMALNYSTGAMTYFTQAIQHDIWDHDFEISPILASGNVMGVQQNVVLGAGKAGFVFAFNRDTGNILWMTAVGMHQNDTFDPITSLKWVEPGALGGVETPMAYMDGILYVPANNLREMMNGTQITAFDFANNTGDLVAINISSGHIIWSVHLTTGGLYGGATVVNDVVFTATSDGTIYAFNRTTGAQVFTFKAPAAINAWPAVSGNMIIWPCGEGANRTLLALSLGGIASSSVAAQPAAAATIAISSSSDLVTFGAVSAGTIVALGAMVVFSGMQATDAPMVGRDEKSAEAPEGEARNTEAERSSCDVEENPLNR